MVLLTASANKSQQLFTDLLPWLLVLIGVVLAGAVAVYAVRRMMTRQDGAGTGGGFTLQDLRDLRARGELTDEEFQRAREAMIGAAGRPARTGEKQPPTGQSGP